MITCTGCGLPKDQDQFAFKNRTTNRRHSRCRDCVSTYNQAHHARNKDRVNKNTSRRAKEHKQEVRAKVREYLEGRACMTCHMAKPRPVGKSGQPALIVLVDPEVTGGRRFSQLVANGWPWRRLEELLRTSPLICPSCHGRKVAAQVQANAKQARQERVDSALAAAAAEVAQIELSSAA